MSTMNISLPDTLESLVDRQVRSRGYSSPSEYICELIRQDQDRQRLRSLLLQGAASPPAITGDTGYFSQLRNRARESVQR